MRLARGLVPLLAVSVVFAAAGERSAVAQPHGSTGSAYQPPRTSWGAPRIEGLWDFRNLTPFERPSAFADQEFFTPEQAREFRDRTLRQLDFDNRSNLPGRFDVEGAYNSFWWDWGTELNEDLRTSQILDPPDGRMPPLTAGAEARRAEELRNRTPPNRELVSINYGSEPFLPEGPESIGLSERCLVGFNAGPPLTPSAYNNNLRIVQTPNHVLLVTEMVHDARVVPLDGRPHLPPGIHRWMGDSRGRWEGDTLVIETTGFTEKTPAFRMPLTTAAGGPIGSGEDLRLVERLTPIAEGRLRYEYTIDAPALFTRPFTVAIPMRASSERMFEYAWHEGNYAMGGMLRGARVLESEADAEEDSASHIR